jgi:hypothetical protein
MRDTRETLHLLEVEEGIATPSQESFQSSDMPPSYITVTSTLAQRSVNEPTPTCWPPPPPNWPSDPWERFDTCFCIFVVFSAFAAYFANQILDGDGRPNLLVQAYIAASIVVFLPRMIEVWYMTKDDFEGYKEWRRQARAAEIIAGGHRWRRFAHYLNYPMALFLGLYVLAFYGEWCARRGSMVFKGEGPFWVGPEGRFYNGSLAYGCMQQCVVDFGRNSAC